MGEYEDKLRRESDKKMQEEAESLRLARGRNGFGVGNKKGEGDEGMGFGKSGGEKMEGADDFKKPRGMFGLGSLEKGLEEVRRRREKNKKEKSGGENGAKKKKKGGGFAGIVLFFLFFGGLGFLSDFFDNVGEDGVSEGGWRELTSDVSNYKFEVSGLVEDDVGGGRGYNYGVFETLEGYHNERREVWREMINVFVMMIREGDDESGVLEEGRELMEELIKRDREIVRERDEWAEGYGGKEEEEIFLMYYLSFLREGDQEREGYYEDLVEGFKKKEEMAGKGEGFWNFNFGKEQEAVMNLSEEEAELMEKVYLEVE